MKPFDAQALLDCYRRGVFPMAESRGDPRLYLVDPDVRGVIPLDAFHLPKRLARTIRSDAFQITVDEAFDAVVEACAEDRPGRDDTWINAPIRHLYGELFDKGAAHSVECRREGRLVGGLYGVSLGGAFFGESMFSDERDASKVALAHLVARLRIGGYRLLDAQFLTSHLAQFGAVEIDRAAYRRRLAAALAVEADFDYAPPSLAGAEALHSISHRS